MTDERHHRLHVLASELMTATALVGCDAHDDGDTELGDACLAVNRACGDLVCRLHERLWPG